MASLFENLIGDLESENSLYDELLSLSTRKTDIIIKGDVEALNKLVAEEQAIVEQINVYEKKRNEVTADIGNVLNRDPSKLTLSNLSELLANQPNEQKKLDEVHKKLTATLNDLKIRNESNKVLLQESLDMVQFEINLLQNMKMAPETANYNKNDYTHEVYVGPGSFDAKQ